ncbi:MAG: efflux RND transporter periplasmic adaptor subunit [Myxococcaceae bacterium]|nr:efflux RND transporter periplasmic adaptor subunit [Myxococcaceae bacterium]
MRRSLLPSSLLLALALGCSQPAPEPAAPTLAPTSARTAWIQPRSARGVALTEAPARVLAEPESAAAAGFPFRATITRIAVRPGQRVQQGEVLLEALMPELVQAAGSYQAATLRREAYARRTAQLQALQQQGMARVFELAEAEAQLAEARAEQQSALAQLRVAGLDASMAANVAQRGTVALRSPVEGVVTEVEVVLGETRESTAGPLVRVVGEGPARIEARLAQAFPEGATFEFSAPGVEGLPVRLLSRAPAVDPRDGTTAAWFEPEPPRVLPTGLQGTVRVRAEALADMTVVPARALVLEGGQASVLVRTPEGYRRQPVQVVASSGADALVRGPLKETDRVAADAARLMETGEAP